MDVPFVGGLEGKGGGGGGQKLKPYIASALSCWMVIINWTRPLVCSCEHGSSDS
jgi:hypothetical protein